MKKSNLIVAFLLILPFVLNAQWNSRDKIKGNGTVVSKNISTSSYDKIKVSGFFDVVLFSGEEGKITIEGEENIIEYIQIEVENNSLNIAVEKGKYIEPSHGKQIIIAVPFDSLNEVCLSGSGDIKSKNLITTDSFNATLSGSGDVNLEVKAKEITADVTGSGNLVLEGATDTFICKVTGSGDLNASKLISDSVNSKVTGSGNCKVNCTQNLEARVTGSGDIEYYGNPIKKDTKVTGSGDISKG
jgi:hypothetical protein